MSSSPNPGAARPVGGRSLLISFVLLFAVGIGFGLMLTLNRVAMLDGIPYLAYVFWQMLGGGSVLLVISLVRSTPPRFDFAHLRCYVLCGLVGMGGSFVLLAIVAPNIPVGVLALGIGISPMVTYPVRVDDEARSVSLAQIGRHGSRPGGRLADRRAPAQPSVIEHDRLGIDRSLPQRAARRANCLDRTLPAPKFRPTCPLGRIHADHGNLPLLRDGDAWRLVVLLRADEQRRLVARGRDRDPAPSTSWPCSSSFAVRGSVFFSTVSYVDILTGMGWGMLIFGEQHSAWIWSALVCLMAGLFMVTKPERNRRTRHS